MNDEPDKPDEEKPEPAPVPPPRYVPPRHQPDSRPSSMAFEEMERPIGVLSLFETLLKKPGQAVHAVNQPGMGKAQVCLFLIAVACLIAYGLIVGLFSGGTQLWAAPAKVAVGSILSGLICLPSLYIFGCLTGADVNLRGVTGLLLGTLAIIGILMIGFAPVAWVFTMSTESLVFMGFLHLVFWGIALVFGLRFLVRGFCYFENRNAGFIVLWMFIFVFVSLQMTTSLRPLLGSDEEHFLPKDKRFFLQHWIDPDGKHWR